MKKYNQPQTEIVSVELTNMLMSCSPIIEIGGDPINGGSGW